MPLRDHFHGWLHQELQWRPFHSAWATTIAFALLAIGIEIMLFLPEAKDLPRIISPVSEAGEPVGPEVYGFNVEPQLLLIVGVLLLLAVVLGYFFSKTDLGLAVPTR